ncbi:hypothetical protein ACLB6G_14305 [Zhengella sp. ZM62]|uniref:hypothetical protein n=1 Tax=Zhengella sedimenti TaxID=3390035 RepID=UPI0039769446
MRADTPPFDVMRHSFWLGDEPEESSAQMRCIAECVGAVRPEIHRLSEIHGDRRMIWSLMAIIVDMSLEADEAALTAALMKTNARLLELEAGNDSPGCTASIL